MFLNLGSRRPGDESDKGGAHPTYTQYHGTKELTIIFIFLHTNYLKKNNNFSF
jgi:hypothetical protein